MGVAGRLAAGAVILGLVCSGAATGQGPDPASSPALQTVTLDFRAPAPEWPASPVSAQVAAASKGAVTVNAHHLSFDGRPVAPVTGEFHYFRFPRADWREQLLKMKAGGVDIVASYVFWIVHEEEQGVYDWSGDRDLRAFIDLCAELDMKLILRVGPFAHGEVRSGGLPDWLLAAPLSVRSNDPLYLGHVERFFGEIGRQAAGRLHRDGGPVIGIQIENEYQHSASPWALSYPGQPHDWTVAPADTAVTNNGVSEARVENRGAEIGVAHMRRLHGLLLAAGLDAPLWTATGWGGAITIPDVTLPVTGAYAYPSWTPSAKPSPLYLYKDLHREPDYAPARYDAAAYPVMSAEIGPGIMPTYTRRPGVPPESTDALVNRFLGGGANLIGYYMLHGGVTPFGRKLFLSDEAFGYPKLSYDFQAPLGEFGDVRTSFRRLKLLHSFMRHFGAELAPLPAVVPATEARPAGPTDVSILRAAGRGADGAGFVFLNNFQDHVATPDRRVALELLTPAGPLRLPETGEMTLRSGENMVLPVNLDLGPARLLTATVQPLARLSGRHLVFFAAPGVATELVLSPDARVQGLAGKGCRADRSTRRVRLACPAGEGVIARFRVMNRAGGQAVDVLIIGKAMAMDAWPLRTAAGDHLAFTGGVILQQGEGPAQLLRTGEARSVVKVYPPLSRNPRALAPARVVRLADAEGMSQLQVSQPAYAPEPATRRVADNKLAVDLSGVSLPDGVSDVWMELDHVADTVQAFRGGQLVADHFWSGRPWKIGLKRFLRQQPDDSAQQPMVFHFRPLQAGLPFLADIAPGVIAPLAPRERRIDVRSVTLTPEYSAELDFN